MKSESSLTCETCATETVIRLIISTCTIQCIASNTWLRKTRIHRNQTSWTRESCSTYTDKSCCDSYTKSIVRTWYRITVINLTIAELTRVALKIPNIQVISLFLWISYLQDIYTRRNYFLIDYIVLRFDMEKNRKDSMLRRIVNLYKNSSIDIDNQ